MSFISKLQNDLNTAWDDFEKDCSGNNTPSNDYVETANKVMSVVSRINEYYEQHKEMADLIKLKQLAEKYGQKVESFMGELKLSVGEQLEALLEASLVGGE